MVRRLVEAGHDVRVLGRDAEKRAAIAELGAQPVDRARPRWPTTPTSVVVCVFTDEQVRAGLPRRRSARRHAVRIGARRCTPPAVPAPPRRWPSAAGRAASPSSTRRSAAARTTSPPGTVTLFVGGDDDAVRAVRAGAVQLRRPGPARRADSAAGQLVKLVNNTLFAAQIGMRGRGGAAGRPARRRRVRAAGGAAARQRQPAGRWASIARGRLGATGSSPPSANSSARTSPSSAQRWPNSAATSAARRRRRRRTRHIEHGPMIDPFPLSR